MSLQPMDLLGQPNAWACDFHMAITTGLSTRDGVSLAPVPTSFVPFFCCHRSLINVSQTLPAGLQMSGLIVPFTICCIDSPDPTAMPLTVIGPSQAVCFWLLKTLITSFIHSCFSLP